MQVSTPEFWKERLDYAKKNGKIEYSVFIANPFIYKRMDKDHQEILNKEISETDKVLDAGCGYGRNRHMVKGFYIGVDISPDLIKEAKLLHPRDTFLVADLTDLQFEDKEFDVGFCISVKAMIVGNLGQTEWDKIEKELKRVCKKVLLLEYGTGDSLSKMDSDKYEII